jgi:hypothetical protein
MDGARRPLQVFHGGELLRRFVDPIGRSNTKPSKLVTPLLHGVVSKVLARKLSMVNNSCQLPHSQAN